MTQALILIMLYLLIRRDDVPLFCVLCWCDNCFLDLGGSLYLFRRCLVYTSAVICNKQLKKDMSPIHLIYMAEYTCENNVVITNMAFLFVVLAFLCLYLLTIYFMDSLGYPDSMRWQHCSTVLSAELRSQV